ncbi:MAG: ASKHA domain-containing protein [Promethearchaeota archaeon]
MNKKNNPIIIDFEPISRRIHFKSDQSIYQTLISNGIRIRSLCGGLGTCGKCKILIQKGKNALTPPTQSEQELLEKEELEKNWRLACQTYLNKHELETVIKGEPPHLRIFLPDEILIEDFKILTEGIQKEMIFNPAVKKFFCIVEPPTLSNPIPDLERLLTKIKKKYGISLHDGARIEYDVLTSIPHVLRTSKNGVTITEWNEQSIIAIEEGNETQNNFGIAIDIGTTTVVGYLLNLNDGKTYAISSKLNPQTAYGEDLITRITFIKENKNGLQKLHDLIIEAINDIIIKTCNIANISPNQIYEASIVGNSVMHHIFLNVDPTNIGLSPYVPALKRNIDLPNKNLGLKIHPNGNIHVLPLIAGFVGADTMGVMLASNVDKEEDLTLVIDIGTNGELIIGNKNVLATGSCAAGSALEGAHIKDGMRAASGSIDTVKINPNTFEVNYTTIKNRPPIGICGSGLIDIIAEMLKSKIITRNGNFNKTFLDHERIIKKNNEYAFLIVNKEDTPLNRNITISQSDIRQIQMAKAAFYSGMRIILQELNSKLINENLKPLSISQIFLAGAFGNYVDKNNAKFIGMIPDIPSEKIFQIGNAAGSGAKLCLINKNLRKKARELLKRITYVEIATKKSFQREYAQAMYFPHMNLDEFLSLKKFYLQHPIR